MSRQLLVTCRWNALSGSWALMGRICNQRNLPCLRGRWCEEDASNEAYYVFHGCWCEQSATSARFYHVREDVRAKKPCNVYHVCKNVGARKMPASKFAMGSGRWCEEVAWNEAYRICERSRSKKLPRLWLPAYGVSF